MKNDAELQRDVMEVLRLEPRVDASHVGVTAREGEVTLTGRVQTHAEKSAAERAAKRVYGVIAVVDKIEVRLPRDNQRTDEDIAQAAVHALRRLATLPESS